MLNEFCTLKPCCLQSAFVGAPYKLAHHMLFVFRMFELDESEPLETETWEAKKEYL
jgi:hypothetical protein